MSDVNTFVQRWASSVILGQHAQAAALERLNLALRLDDFRRLRHALARRGLMLYYSARHKRKHEQAKTEDREG